MKAIPVWLRVFVGLTVGALFTIGAWFLTTQKNQIQQEVETTLSVTNRLKVEQIAGWRADRLAEAAEIMERPFVADWLANWLKDPQPEQSKYILDLFQTLVRYDRYFDILLVDSKGNVRINLYENPREQISEVQSVLNQAFTEKRPLLTQIHGGTTDLPEHLDMIAPLIIRKGSEETIAGALILVNDVREFLYPLLQFWPLPSKSAECLLVVREGDHARIFSHRLSAEGKGFEGSIPLDRSEVLAVKAALGKEGIHYGKDYRGVDAVAVIHQIPDSSWALVTKIDASEAFSDWRSKAFLIIGLLVGYTLLLLTLGILLLLYYRSLHYRQMLEAEHAYRDSEARYRTLFEANPQPMWVYDLETLNFLAVNDSAVQRYGYSRDEFLSMTIKDIRPEEDIPRLLENVSQVKSGLDEAGIWRHRKKNGEVIFVEISSYTLDWKGRPAEIVLADDVTGRIESERNLRESEERFRAVVESAPEAIFIQTRGCFAYLNPAGALLFGIQERDLLIGKPVTDFFHPDDRALVMERISALNDERKAVPLVGERILRLDGKPVDVEALAVPFDYQGEHGALVFLRDISERKRSEEEREHLVRAIEQAAEAILICDSNGMIQYVNPAFETITGYSREEAIGQNPRILKSGQQDEKFYRELWHTISSGEVWEGRFINRRKDGTLITEEASITPIRDKNGTIVNYVAVKRDITDQLSLEAEKQHLQDQLLQAQKMEAVGRLAGGVAHDFNNMLQAILGYTDLALGSVDPDEPIYSDLLEVQKAAQRSVELTRHLLAFARKQPNNPKALDINSVISGLLKMLRRLIGEDIDLVFDPGPDIWMMKIDPSQVDQILANLVVNARDAITGTGKITIETRNVVFDEEYCTIHAGYIPGEYVLLIVSDSGHGMDKETLSHVFEPFFTTKRAGEGTGLGLATVYGIVKQNQGFINVYSEVGLGTSFRLYFPHYTESNGVEIHYQKPAQIVGGKESVLMVEDENLILDLGERMLRQLGYQVLTARSPEEAIHLVQNLSNELDLVITDVVMPWMNGRELVGKLLDLRPNLKCLYMSGYTADVIAHRGILDKGVHFIQKPFTVETLAAKVREVLDEVEN